MAARILAFPLLLLAGCYDQPASDNFGSTTPRPERPTSDSSTLKAAVAPVRIGELGRDFAACNAQGQVNERSGEEPIPVRAAPFAEARRTGSLRPGSTFFICSRSLDQHWMGVVYEAPGRAARSCGVSTPVESRREYEGPCDSGWVASAQVRLISGIAPAADESNGNVGQPK